jgi:hypothetical protein
MDDKDEVRRAIERLILAENRGKAGGEAEAEDVLDEGFLGVTRAKGREQELPDYLAEIAGADYASQTDTRNKRRWLDIPDPATAPELDEPGSAGLRKGSNMGIFGDAAVVRAVVSTRAPGTADRADRCYRNTFALVRRPSGWRVIAWQVTELPG